MKSNKAEIESRSSQIKGKYQLYLDDQAKAETVDGEIQAIDEEMATLRESLAKLPETNPDWEEISNLAGVKIAFTKDLRELDETLETETSQQVHLRQSYKNRITEVDIAVQGLTETSPDAMYIAETAQRQLELDDEKIVLIEELKDLKLGTSNIPMETS